MRPKPLTHTATAAAAIAQGPSGTIAARPAPIGRGSRGASAQPWQLCYDVPHKPLRLSNASFCVGTACCDNAGRGTPRSSIWRLGHTLQVVNVASKARHFVVAVCTRRSKPARLNTQPASVALPRIAWYQSRFAVSPRDGAGLPAGASCRRRCRPPPPARALPGGERQGRCHGHHRRTWQVILYGGRSSSFWVVCLCLPSPVGRHILSPH